MKESTFESIGGTYKMTNDYLIPDLTIAENPVSRQVGAAPQALSP